MTSLASRPTRMLVLGRGGQLARALERAAGGAGFVATFRGSAEVDLSAPGAVSALIREQAPDVVVNACAYTAVDRAEDDVEAARRLNAALPAEAARACAEIGAALVHVSTDYVFDGEATQAYRPDDPVAPRSVYGRTKADGELAVLASGASAAVLRTSWVYGPDGANFLKTMLRLAESRDEVGVVGDQIGRPTQVDDLASGCLAAARGLVEGLEGSAGLFHCGGRDDASWADFAVEIFSQAEALGLPHARVRAIATSDYPTRAVRPKNSRMDTDAFEARFGWRARGMAEGVAATLGALALERARQG
jgi:dTDP-4-dehydrorhamnose reductase